MQTGKGDEKQQTTKTILVSKNCDDVRYSQATSLFNMICNCSSFYQPNLWIGLKELSLENILVEAQVLV